MRPTEVVSIQDAVSNKTDQLQQSKLVVMVPWRSEPKIEHIFGSDVKSRVIASIARQACDDIDPEARIAGPAALLNGDFNELIPDAEKEKLLDNAAGFATQSPDVASRLAEIIDRSRAAITSFDEESESAEEQLNSGSFDDLRFEIAAIASNSPEIYDILADPESLSTKTMAQIKTLECTIPVGMVAAGDLVTVFVQQHKSLATVRQARRDRARAAIDDGLIDAAAAVSLLEVNNRQPLDDLILVVGDINKCFRSADFAAQLNRLSGRTAFDVLIASPTSVTTVDHGIETFDNAGLTVTMFWSPKARGFDQALEVGRRFPLKATPSAAGHWCQYGTVHHFGRRAVAAAAKIGQRRAIDRLLAPYGDLYGMLNASFGAYNASIKEILGADDIAGCNEFTDKEKLELAELGINTFSVEDGMLIPFLARTRSSLKDWQQADGARAVRIITDAIKQALRRLSGANNEIRRESEARRQLSSILGLIEHSGIISFELKKSITSTGRRLDLIACVKVLEALETVTVLRMVQAL